jgi:hypothetical protein
VVEEVELLPVAVGGDPSSVAGRLLPGLVLPLDGDLQHAVEDPLVG